MEVFDTKGLRRVLGVNAMGEEIDVAVGESKVV